MSIITKILEARRMKGEDPCDTGYKMLGLKMKDGRKVPNCVDEEEDTDDYKMSKSGKKYKAHRIVFNKGEDDGKTNVAEQHGVTEMKKTFKEFTKSMKEKSTCEEVDLVGEELDEAINEVLSKDASAGEWISDFVHSDNPKFEGKSKEKRKQMALAAYYAKQRNEEIELEEGSSKVWAVTGTWTHRKHQKEPITTTTRVNAKSPEEAMDKYKSHMSQKYERKVHKMKVKPHTNQASTATRIEHVEIDESAVTHIVAKKDLQKHKDWMDSEGFDTNTKPLPKSHPKHSTHVGIVSKNSQESSYHEEGHASPIKEEVEIDEADNLALRGLHTANPQSIPSYMRSTEKGKKSLADKNKPVLKSLIKGQLGKHPKANLPEEVEELDELSKKTLGSYVKAAAKDAEEAGQAQEYHGHKMDYERGEKRQKGIGKAVDRLTKEEVELEEELKGDMHPDAAKVLRHIKPEHHSTYKPYLKKGVYKGDYKDRSAVLSAAEKAGHIKEAFPSKDYKSVVPKTSTSTFHDVKSTSTGTVYTKKFNPDGTSMGSGSDAAPAPKRGRGRPKKKFAEAAEILLALSEEDFDMFMEEGFETFAEALEELTEQELHELKEKLVGYQHKLDRNKNGKLDKQDFKLLRK